MDTRIRIPYNLSETILSIGGVAPEVSLKNHLDAGNKLLK